MANLKVGIYLRIARASGVRRFVKAVGLNGKKYSNSGSLKPGYGIVDGKAEYHPEGVYYLQYRQGTKQVWERVSADAFHALDAKATRERILRDLSRGILPAPIETPPLETRPRLCNLKNEFLEYKRTTAKKDGTPLDKETLDAYKRQVSEFIVNCHHEYTADVDGQDLRRYMAALRARGLAHRSVCNNYTGIVSFLKFCNVDHKKLLPYSERPSPDDGIPQAYDETEMHQFFAVIRRERDLLAFETLLKTGLREREMTTLEWTDLNLGQRPTLTVQSRKPDLNFRSKAGKSRTIPLEKSLALKLAAWRTKHPTTRLVFGTSTDKEDSHYYRVCRELAKRAGMDPDRFWLHKFRDTFGTWTCRAGKVDLRTLQHWMGHSSITMTERYLAPGEGSYAQTGINETFNLQFTTFMPSHAG